MKKFIFSALLSTTILSSSLTFTAIASGHGSQKVIGQTHALIAEAGLPIISDANSSNNNLKDGESANTNFPFANFKAIPQLGRLTLYLV